MKISANVVMKAVGLLWTLAWAIRDGELDDQEIASISVKLEQLIKVLEEVL